MASEKTPNLGLNQIDRTSPKTTYFDLEKYLDQNWRAVDNFAGDVNDGVDAIKKRLDTTERKEVTLSPGVQIVHAEKASPFSLTGLSGRTLVNLLGRWGNLSSLTGITPYQSEIALDTTNKGTMSNSLKVTIKSGYTVGVGFYSDFKFLAGKYYVAIAKVKVGNSTNAGISAPNVQEGTTVTDKTKFTTSWFRAAPTSNVTSNIDLRIQGTQGQYSYFEAVRIYEISSADYSALAAMTTDQIDAKYPYVDSVMPARNPYAIRYGENMLPPFSEWKLNANTVVLDPYKLQLKATAGNQSSLVSIPCAPNTGYKVSGTIPLGTYVQAIFYDANGVRIGDMFSTTITTPSNCYLMDIILQNNSAEGAIGTFIFDRIMMNVGGTAKPFKPREDFMLAMQTDLYADPVTGANADTVFERDGQYFKAEKWNSVTLDGSFVWTLPGSYPGYKVAGISGLGPAKAYDSLYVAKYDGKILTHNSAMTAADNAYFRNQTTKDAFDVSISNSDSGWGDSYTPTADEIKAYFMGWRMRNQTTLDPYTSGVKAWGTVLSGGSDNYTNTLPTTPAPDYKTPYQLVYQLATPTVEPIVSEGQLTFVEGDNQIETGTGIVLRESVKPLPYPNAVGRWMINYTGSGGPTNPLKNRPSKILAVHGNGFSEPYNWGVTAIDGGWYGNVYIDRLYSYSSEKSYSVTYLMLDRSPVVPLTGSYAANEKTLLVDLVESVQQTNTRLSVVENKKADKDNPAWITPTLINGVTAETSGADMLPQYLKTSNGFVKMHGSITVPNGAGVIFAKLPEGYRPKILAVLSCAASDAVSSDKTAFISVSPNGNVAVSGRGGYGWIRLDNVQFIAEQ
ncbi:hypothetical protein [Paenibacillus sp. NRS-1780]|uniref:hypothetical protein n=1 Tax=Paenibacillus sp. NRS-1780 TaxID=3233904 RepID=UPI003D29818F